MFDNSGNIGSSTFNINVITSVYDNMPPILTTNTLTDRTDTTAKLHLVTSELLRKCKIRYRIIGDTQWMEQVLNPSSMVFDVNLSNLLSGQAYEYQYTLEDNSGNQSITEWVGI